MHLIVFFTAPTAHLRPRPLPTTTWRAVHCIAQLQFVFRFSGRSKVKQMSVLQDWITNMEYSGFGIKYKYHVLNNELDFIYLSTVVDKNC